MPANATYDVVIVGAGIAGAIMAKELATQGNIGSPVPARTFTTFITNAGAGHSNGR